MAAFVFAVGELMNLSVVNRTEFNTPETAMGTSAPNSSSKPVLNSITLNLNVKSRK